MLERKRILPPPISVAIQVAAGERRVKSYATQAFTTYIFFIFLL